MIVKITDTYLLPTDKIPTDKMYTHQRKTTDPPCDHHYGLTRDDTFDATPHGCCFFILIFAFDE
jgi:hypothetical protein